MAAVHILVALLVCATGLLVGLIVSRHRGKAARRDDQRYRVLVESFPSGAVFMFDRRLRHTLAAGRGLAEMGFSVADVEGKTVRELFSGDLCAILEPVYRAALEGRESALELPLANRDYLVHVAPLSSDADRISGGLVTAQDTTDRKRHVHRLAELASRDGLTGLWNRRRLAEEIEWLLRDALRWGGRSGSLLMLDLNGFKRINDAQGHEAGDDLLQRVARSLEASVRRTDAVARLGGDEFAVLLPGATTEEAERVAAKVATEIEAVWPSGARGGASVGIAAVGEDNWSVSDVLACADRAMYAAKRAARLRAVS